MNDATVKLAEALGVPLGVHLDKDAAELLITAARLTERAVTIASGRDTEEKRAEIASAFVLRYQQRAGDLPVILKPAQLRAVATYAAAVVAKPAQE